MSVVASAVRTWDTQRDAWRRVPVDDVGYFDAQALADLPDDELRGIVNRMEACRYQGWRNTSGLWRQHMGLDDITGKDILDYGCGTGMESLQYAKNKNNVSIADINQGSLCLADRVLTLRGYSPVHTFLISASTPGKLRYALDESFDVVVMNGVLHHIENPLPAVTEVHRVLRPGGELRVMVYTDTGWRLATGTEPPDDVTNHPAREQFVRWGDEVGDWADWYNAKRLHQRFGSIFNLREWHYIGQAADNVANGTGRYGIGVMEKI